MGKYDHIYNKKLVDLVNEQINIDRLWDALHDHVTPRIHIEFFYTDGDKLVYKYNRYVMDDIYFDYDDLILTLKHDRLVSIKYGHEEMVFDSLDTLEILESIVMTNIYRPTEYIFKLDIQNYIPIQGTKVINWS